MRPLFFICAGKRIICQQCKSPREAVASLSAPNTHVIIEFKSDLREPSLHAVTQKMIPSHITSLAFLLRLSHQRCSHARITAPENARNPIRQITGVLQPFQLHIDCLARETGSTDFIIYHTILRTGPGSDCHQRALFPFALLRVHDRFIVTESAVPFPAIASKSGRFLGSFKGGLRLDIGGEFFGGAVRV
jgi:hypothetical protein